MADRAISATPDRVVSDAPAKPNPIQLIGQAVGSFFGGLLSGFQQPPAQTVEAQPTPVAVVPDSPAAQSSLSAPAAWKSDGRTQQRASVKVASISSSSADAVATSEDGGGGGDGAPHGVVENEAFDPAKAETTSNEEWVGWLVEALRSSPAYATHALLLDECAAVAASWRTRFWDRKALWGRIRKGNRLAKELAEAAPMLARARAEMAALDLGPTGRKAVVIDLCSGFGYLGMFLSELLPPSKVDRIVLVDKQWAPHNAARQSRHLNPEHIHDADWPIRLTTSHSDLKVPSDRRSLLRAFVQREDTPAMLLGVHLCGTLSLRAVELFNGSPHFFFLGLKPCCLPELLFAKRGDVFGAANGHFFPAKEVAAAGKWKRGKWVGGAGRDELERKFHSWTYNLSKCVDCDEDEGEAKCVECNDGNGYAGGAVGAAPASRGAGTLGVRVETHCVQERWFLNSFIFGTRRWSSSGCAARAAPPGSMAAAASSTGAAAALNTSNGSGVSEAHRAALLAEFEEKKRQQKRDRRSGKRSVDKQAMCDAKRAERDANPLVVTVEALSGTRVALRCLLEVHRGTYVELG